MRILKRITTIIMVMILTLACIGCGKKETLVGTWESENYTYILNEDGTGVEKFGSYDMNITSYSTKDGKLSITIEFLGTEETTEYSYSIKKDTLVLSDDDGKEMTFTRK